MFENKWNFLQKIPRYDPRKITILLLFTYFISKITSKSKFLYVTFYENWRFNILRLLYDAADKDSFRKNWLSFTKLNVISTKQKYVIDFGANEESNKKISRRTKLLTHDLLYFFFFSLRLTFGASECVSYVRQVFLRYSFFPESSFINFARQ